jgi:signal transduction histidine kinase/ligand-binding sensor protein
MAKEHNGHIEYVELFQEKIADFLDGLLAAFNKQWQSGFVLLQTDTREKLYEVKKEFAPFCQYIREDLGMRDICLKCDDQKAKIAAGKEEPIHYWCVWGLHEIAVPIMIHGHSEGTIFCGQKILADKNKDIEGEKILKDYAHENKLDEYIPILMEKRKETKQISEDEIKQMKKLLWAISQFITQVFNNFTDKESYQTEKNQLKINLNNSLNQIRDNSKFYRFWTDYRNVLHKLVDLMNSRIALVLVIDNKVTKIESFPPLSYKLPPNFDKEQLITAQEILQGPQQTSDIASLKSCPVCRYVIERYPGINMVLFEKSQLEQEKEIHLLIFFDSTMSPRYNFYPHEKEQILSQLILETIKVYIQLNKIQQLNTSLDEKEAFLKDIAHQIRQPLHSIVAYCDNLMQSDFPLERKERIPRLLREIAFQCSTLVRCIEYAARGEKNIFSTEEIKPEIHDLSRLLIDYVKNMQGYSEEQKIYMHVENPDTDVIGLINVDKFKLELAMNNVLYNAVKYSFPKTRISVSVIHDHQNNTLAVLVTNYGIEIPEDKWISIFTRGERTKLARQYSQSGLGIGLFVAREVMLAMGGDAKVLKSEPTGKCYQDFNEYKNIIVLTLPGTVLLSRREI